jgi:hypothetical protein
VAPSLASALASPTLVPASPDVLVAPPEVALAPPVVAVALPAVLLAPPVVVVLPPPVVTEFAPSVPSVPPPLAPPPSPSAGPGPVSEAGSVELHPTTTDMNTGRTASFLRRVGATKINWQCLRWLDPSPYHGTSSHGVRLQQMNIARK